MPIYLVTPLAQNYDAVCEAVKAHVASDDYFEIQANAGFFVRSPDTTVEMSHSLGFTTPDRSPTTVGPVLVTQVNSYYGRGSAEMWDWLKTRMEKG